MTTTYKINKTELSKTQAAEERLERAFKAAHKAMGLATLHGRPVSLSMETATILAALITIYKE